jgi:hypothetical protein
MVGVVVTAAVAALAASCLLGRLRPWQRLGDWAADQVHFTRAWMIRSPPCSRMSGSTIASKNRAQPSRSCPSPGRRRAAGHVHEDVVRPQLLLDSGHVALNGFEVAEVPLFGGRRGQGARRC